MMPRYLQLLAQRTCSVFALEAVVFKTLAAPERQPTPPSYKSVLQASSN